MMYGTICGLLSFIIFIIIYLIGKNPLGSWSWFAFWLPILFIVLGVQRHRDKDLDGFIGYGRALGTGTLISLFSTLFFSVLAYAFMSFVGTDILEVHRQEMLEGMEQAKSFMGDEWYEKIVAEIEVMTNGEAAMQEFQRKILAGVVYSLVIAGFLRRKKTIFDQPAQ